MIVNCTNHEKHYLKISRDPYRLKYLKVPVNDDLTNKSLKAMKKFLDPVTRIIHQQISEDKKVFLHCYRGVQRSATVAVGYLVRYNGMPLEDAIRHVQKNRSCAFRPENNFIDALIEFEKDLRFHQVTSCKMQVETGFNDKPASCCGGF